MGYYNRNPYERETAEDLHDRNLANVTINDHISQGIREWLKATEPVKPTRHADEWLTNPLVRQAFAKSLLDIRRKYQALRRKYPGSLFICDYLIETTGARNTALEIDLALRYGGAK